MQYKASAHALVKPLDDGAIALNTATGEYYSLNETALLMWLMLVEGRTEDEIVRNVVAKYDIESLAVRADLARLIHELERMELLGPN